MVEGFTDLKIDGSYIKELILMPSQILSGRPRPERTREMVETCTFTDSFSSRKLCNSAKEISLCSRTFRFKS